MQRVKSIIIHQLHLFVYDDGVEVNCCAVVNRVEQPLPHYGDGGVERHDQPEAASGRCWKPIVVNSGATLHIAVENRNGWEVNQREPTDPSPSRMEATEPERPAMQ